MTWPSWPHIDITDANLPTTNMLVIEVPVAADLPANLPTTDGDKADLPRNEVENIPKADNTNVALREVLAEITSEKTNAIDIIPPFLIHDCLSPENILS